MDNSSTIEARLSALERQMEEVRREIDRQRKEGNWIEKITGSFKDDPDFGEIIRLGREARQADRLMDDE
jgi:hypothetical protein